MRLGVVEEGRRTLDEMFAEPHRLQSKLSLEIHAANSVALRAVGPQVAHRLDSNSGEAAALINAVPNSIHNTISVAAQMRERMALRLGMDVSYMVPGPCKCKSRHSAPRTLDGFVDTKGYHLQSVCLLGGNRISNHNAVRDTVMEMARSANFTSRTSDKNTKMDLVIFG